jgi:diguanylate cyclase (GGDEF)-like protein/PAS domain S-box-containing protein
MQNMNQPKQKIRVLLIEDEESDAYLVKLDLKQSHSVIFDVTWVETLGAAQKVLQVVTFDVVLLDLSLPDSEGLETIKMTQKITNDLPIIVLTGRCDTDFSLIALKNGASDYMVKGDFGFDGIARTIRFCLLRAEMDTHNKLLVSALEAAGNGIIITDKDANIKWANPAFSRLTGYTLEEVIGNKPNYLVSSGQQDQPFYAEMWEKLLQGRHWKGEVINKHKDGSLYHEELNIAPVKNNRGEIVNFIGIKENISDRKALEEKLQQLANTDPLTGLFNRRVFLERLAQESERLSRLGGFAAFLMLDLDFFKQVNDTFGHTIGDEVLKNFADIMRKNSRNIDVPARLGGEEFAILLLSTNQHDATIMAERLRKQVENMVIQHPTKGNVKITVSIGASELNPFDTDGEIAWRNADDALYLAKNRGRNQTCWFENSAH